VFNFQSKKAKQPGRKKGFFWQSVKV